jgi:hypothetical protein
MTATATLVHSSSRTADNALRIARVAAAGRVAAERRAEDTRREAQYVGALASATEWVEDVRALGAVRIGHKICLADGGKWRGMIGVEEAAEFLARAVKWEDDVEAWAVDAAGQYVGGCW